jgi:hypothetical protein
MPIFRRAQAVHRTADMPGAKRGRIEQFRDNRIVELDRRRVPRQPYPALQLYSSYQLPAPPIRR